MDAEEDSPGGLLDETAVEMGQAGSTSLNRDEGEGATDEVVQCVDLAWSNFSVLSSAFLLMPW